MEGGDASGVYENKDLMENDTIIAEPATLLVVKASSELEVDGVKESRNGGEMKNEISELISSPDMTVNVNSPSVSQSVVSPDSIFHPQLGIIPSASEVRRILGPLIAHNALARNGTLEKDKLSTEPRDEIQNLLTDEICNKFAGQMRVVEDQRGTLPLNGISNTDNSKIPKAPRAMLISEKVRVVEDYLLLQDHNKDSKATNSQSPDLMRIPIPSSATDNTSSVVHQGRPSNSSSTSNVGIAIPLDSKFFAHTKNLEREEGEITSSKPSSVAASPVKRYSIDGGRHPRRSSSPEPVRYRPPVSRTYRSRSPERLVRHSHSPNHPKRPISPEGRTGRSSRSPDGPRHLGRRRSSPSPRIPHVFDRPPPISPRSATHKRRGSDFDTRHGKYADDEPYPPRDNRYVESPISRYPDGQKDPFGARDGMPLSDHRASNHDWQRGSTQERGSDTGSTRPHASKRSVSSTNSLNHKVDDHRRSQSRGPTPSPSSITRPLPDDIKVESDPPPQVVKACHNVPGLWMVKSGQSSIEIVTCEFEIDNVTADKWGIRGSSRHGKEKAHDILSLSLACVPLSEVMDRRGKLDLTSATQREIAEEMAQLETVWPPAGHLVIQINPEQEWGRSWLPRHLGEGYPSINITNHVHEGTNVVHFIQLAAQADRMFFVLAKEKPPDLDTIDLEPEPAVAVEEGAEMTTEQLLKSFVATTRIIYS